MVVVVMKCPKDDCVYDTDSETDIAKQTTVAEKLQLLELHVSLMHVVPPPVPPAAPAARTEKFPHPKLTLMDEYINEEVREYFINSW